MNLLHFSIMEIRNFFYEINYFTLFRGAASKTELSLVDKIELARPYQPMTGKQIGI